MKTMLRSAVSALALASLFAAQPLPFTGQSHAAAIAAPAPVAAPAGGAVDVVLDWIKGGLNSAAVAFTNAGAAIVTNRITQAGTAPKNIGWGIGTGAAAVGDTALGTESVPTTSGGRTVGTESRTTVTNTNDNYQVTGTVTAAGTLAITEAGLFDAVTAGNCLIRAVFSAVNVLSGDSIAFTFGLKFVPSVT